MSEPLDPITLKRLAYTEAQKARVRPVDMPAVGVEVQLGVPYKPAEPVVPETPPARLVCRGDVVRIQGIVCGVWGIPLDAMASERRSRVWSWPRQCAVDLCRKLLPLYSLPYIGHRFGGRDHTTVIHAIKVCAVRLASERPDHVAFAVLYRDAEAKARAALGTPGAADG